MGLVSQIPAPDPGVVRLGPHSVTAVGEKLTTKRQHLERSPGETDKLKQFTKQAHKAIKRFRCPSNGRIPTKERVARLGQACTLDNHAVPPGGASGVAGTSTLGAASSRNARIVDPDLLGLTYSYSRYLLISSSRPGTKPANLQGIWADGMNAPWNGDYHLNINLQMSYWGVFAANLVEMAAPIAPFIQDLAIDGRRVAKAWYNASGWVAHGFTDISGRAGSMAS